MPSKVKFLLLFFVLIPVVSAEIVIEGPQKEIFNVGEEMLIDGYILADIAVSGEFKLNLKCENQDPTSLRVMYVNLVVGEKITFSELDIEEVPVAATGYCHFLAFVNQGGKFIDVTESKKFNLSNELNADVEVEETESKLIVKGVATQIDGDKVDGTAKITINKGTNVAFIDTERVRRGSFKYVFEFGNNPPGDYVFNLQITDRFGNVKTLNNLREFAISNTNNKDFSIPDVLYWIVILALALFIVYHMKFKKTKHVFKH